MYRNYTDNLIALEAFKAGEFDLIKEYRSRTWVRQHAGVKWDDGRILKADMPTRNGYYMQSYNLNMRRPLFQDIRVREALGYTYDFETLNKTKVFTRANSVFNNSSSPPRACPVPRSWRCWSHSAPNCRRGFSARPSSHHAPTPSRWRCAATCSRHASC